MSVTKILLGNALKFTTAAYVGNDVIDLDTTAFVLTITRPDTVEITRTNADLTLDETGKVYWAQYTPTVAGTYTWYWQQTGEVPAADENTFIVEAPGT